MAIRYPAVFLGGPPNSGKSWLVRHLSAQLRQRGVMHYVLRAHPDGEGAWRYEAPPPEAARLRELAKRTWTPAFAEAISRDIERRHLPLLVDTGGKVSPETRQILSHCTNAILLSHTPALLADWLRDLDEQAIPLLAELHSIKDGATELTDAGVTLRGTVRGLGPGATPSGPALELLVERLDALLRIEPVVLRRRHAALTNLDVLDLEGPIGSLAAHRDAQHPWIPAELANLLRELEPGRPLALYGVGPTWLYSALAAHTAPAALELFQVALGWVAPPPLVRDGPPDPQRLLVERRRAGEGIAHLQLSLPSTYLDYRDCIDHPLTVPAVADGEAVILDGKLPLWLYAALSRSYANARWLAIREPRTDPPQAVVIASNDPGQLPGSLATCHKATS